MKSSRHGFIVPLLLLITAAVFIVGGFYAYTQHTNLFTLLTVPTNTGVPINTTPPDTEAPVVSSVSPQTINTTGGADLNATPIIITGAHFSLVRIRILKPSTGKDVTVGLSADTPDSITATSTTFTVYMPNFIVPGTYKLVVENDSSGLQSAPVSFTIGSKLFKYPKVAVQGSNQKSSAPISIYAAPQETTPIVTPVASPIDTSNNNVPYVAPSPVIPSPVIPSPTLDFSVSSNAVPYNTPVTLTWSSLNVNSCTASGGWSGTEALFGSQNITAVTVSQTYTLACTGPGGSISRNVTVTVGTAPDTTAPTVSINSPTNSSTVSGIVSIAATASDNVGITKVEFYKNGNLFSTAPSTPFSASWDTTAETNGTFSWTAKAYDAAGNVGTASGISLIVNNVAPTVLDTTLPVVAITAPAGGATVSGTQNVTATASDNVGVTKVEFYKNGSLISTDTASPFSFSWDTTAETNGTFSWTAKAYDAAGNVGIAGPVSLTVYNLVINIINLGGSAPAVTLGTANASLIFNGATTLTWSSTNATSCSASGDWSGTKALSGSQTTGNLTANKTYTITCSNSAGDTSKTVTVNVAALTPAGNDVASVSQAQIEALIVRKTPPTISGNPPYAFSAANIFNSDGSRNSGVWASGVDLTCIPQTSATNGVLVTKRDMLFANHFGVSNPTFVDNSGNVISRTVVASQLISNSVGDSDILVATLDSDVPAGITPCALAPSNIRSYSNGDVPAVFTNQDRTLLLGQIMVISSLVYINSFFTSDFSYYRDFSNWTYPIRTFDSGAPAFLLVNGKLALLTNWHYGGASGPVDADNIAQINAAITANGSPYAVSTVDLSGFTSY